MTEIATIGALVEAFGHPTQCTEPAPGEVVSAASNGITVTVGGVTQEVATIASADISVPSHAHDHSTLQGCHQNQSHTIDPDTGEPTITVNGSPVYLVDTAVTTDPTSGGNVDITDNPADTKIQKL